MARTYYDSDADLAVLQGRRIGIVGYGNQGRAQALNMKDSGIKSTMIATARDASFELAQEDGFQVMDIPEMIPLVELYISKEPAYMLEKMAEIGLYGQMPLHSHTSQYGQYSRAEALDKSFIRKTLEDAYANLESGAFAREWKAEQENGFPEFKRLRDKALKSDMVKLEEKLLKK